MQTDVGRASQPQDSTTTLNQGIFGRVAPISGATVALDVDHADSESNEGCPTSGGAYYAIGGDRLASSEVMGRVEWSFDSAGTSLREVSAPHRMTRGLEVIRTENWDLGLVLYSADKSTSGCLSAMASSFSVASRGWRTPCSQLSTVLALTFMMRANVAWLTLNDWRMARIWFGLSGLGGGGSSATRRVVFLPCS